MDDSHQIAHAVIQWHCISKLILSCRHLQQNVDDPSSQITPCMWLQPNPSSHFRSSLRSSVVSSSTLAENPDYEHKVLCIPHNHERVQPNTPKAVKCKRKETQMTFVNDYARHTSHLLDRVYLPKHPGNALSHIPSITLSAVRQELKLAMPQQLAGKTHQDLIEAVFKSVKVSAYGGSSLNDIISWVISPCLSILTPLPLLLALHLLW